MAIDSLAQQGYLIHLTKYTLSSPWQRALLVTTVPFLQWYADPLQADLGTTLHTPAYVFTHLP